MPKYAVMFYQKGKKGKTWGKTSGKTTNYDNDKNSI